MESNHRNGTIRRDVQVTIPELLVKPVVVRNRVHIPMDVYVINYKTTDGKVFSTLDEAELQQTYLQLEQDIKEWLQYQNEPDLEVYFSEHGHVLSCFSVVFPVDQLRIAIEKLEVLEPVIKKKRLDLPSNLEPPDEDGNLHWVIMVYEWDSYSEYGNVSYQIHNYHELMEEIKELSWEEEFGDV